MATVIFAYNSTDEIPAVGDQRKSFNVVFAEDSKARVESVRHEIIDQSRRRDVVGTTLILWFKLGSTILSDADNRAWFEAYFRAAHRWAVYGNFKDTDNGADDNLCKCNPDADEAEIRVRYDLDTGYILESERVF